uniref:Cilia- and flagella-associated protein 36 n=1 Tax=Fibrocapsa japonica TaxID=94617 RepID=A0A7S2V171_9STRA
MEAKYKEDDEFVDAKSESKTGAKSIGAKDSDSRPIVEKVQQYFYEDDDFAKIFEDFVAEHAHIVDLDTEENRLEYTELYQQFQALYEKHLEAFIVEQGSSVMEFYQQLKKATDEDQTSAIALFGQILTATCDFDIFMLMMKEAREKEVEAGHK